MKERVYICCDLKSFYASAECVERGLDPMTTHLVVADRGRTEKTICLAVSPSLKAYSIPGRARLFEVVQRVREVNDLRRRRAPGGRFSGASRDASELAANPRLEAEYITAPPRMGRYIYWSTKIYEVYLKYLAPEDIFPYSIDEVFMDVTDYLPALGMTARELARTMILDVLKTTGIPAAAGIGANLYLAKVAMDIVAKHTQPDAFGVRIAQLDEMTYRRQLWDHRPLTDFWRVGPGYAKKLEENGLYTMGDIARCSLGKESDYCNEELLYRLFGVNAEILIDHAWGWEPCTLADVKAYEPESKSIVSGQVLQQPYSFEKARLVLREMADGLALDLTERGLVTDRLVLTVGYDAESLAAPGREGGYRGEVTTDRYGRRIPKHAHGTVPLGRYTASSGEMVRAAAELYDRILDKKLLVRRLSLAADRILPEEETPEETGGEQLDLFHDPAVREAEEAARAREKRKQRAILDIRRKYGRNALLKGMDLEEGATARERNQSIGGHRA